MGFGIKGEEGIKDKVKEFLDVISRMLRARGLEYIEVELRELENIFALIVLGSFIGIPSPPTFVSLRLLPHMGRELLVMTSVSKRLDDMLGEMAGIFDIA